MTFQTSFPPSNPILPLLRSWKLIGNERSYSFPELGAYQPCIKEKKENVQLWNFLNPLHVHVFFVSVPFCVCTILHGVNWISHVPRVPDFRCSTFCGINFFHNFIFPCLCNKTIDACSGSSFLLSADVMTSALFGTSKNLKFFLILYSGAFCSNCEWWRWTLESSFVYYCIKI